MVARVAYASNSTSDTEPTAAGVCEIQFGEPNLNKKTGEVVGHSAVSGEEVMSK